MDSDFHYYGTGTAALSAGFNEEDAILIANVAQYVDWFNSDYWSNWYLVDNGGNPVKNSKDEQYKYSYPQLSVQTIDAKMAVDYDKDIWNAFYFPPGNLPYILKNPNQWEKEFFEQYKDRKTSLGDKDNGLCRPFSEFAHAMILDTVNKYKILSSTNNQKEVEKLVQSYLGTTRERCSVSDGKELAKYLLGIRMHVLADTWAHQDFTGGSSKNINGAGINNRVEAKDDNGIYQKHYMDRYGMGFWSGYGLCCRTDCIYGYGLFRTWADGTLSRLFLVNV